MSQTTRQATPEEHVSLISGLHMCVCVHTPQELQFLLTPLKNPWVRLHVSARWFREGCLLERGVTNIAERHPSQPMEVTVGTLEMAVKYSTDI